MSSNEQDQLDPLEAEALDYLVESGFDSASVDRMPPHLREAARRLLGELSAVDRYPAEPPCDSLVDATLASIERAERNQRERLAFPSESARRSRWRTPNFIAVAAVVVVAVGVLFPVANQVRWSNSQGLCASGLRNLGSGIAGYSADNRGMVPMTAGLGGLFSGDSKGDEGVLENAAHLEMLSRQGYCTPACTKCNGTRGLSYRVPLNKAQMVLAAHSRSPIAADANPVQAMTRRGATAPSHLLGSDNHGNRGQNILFSDGSVDWSLTPILQFRPSGIVDNIWVIQQRSGGESLDFRGRGNSPFDIWLSN